MLFRLLAACLAFSALLGALPASAQGPSASLPPEVEAALARGKLPREAITFLVTEVDAKVPSRLAHRANVAVNPASVAKLATTFAALELLGPAYAWSTPVYVDGVVRDGTLQGNLHIKGNGDPKLVAERVWLLLRRVQGLGIRNIAGDIVLDTTAFNLPEHNPAAFDGEPLRAHNAGPGALLLNFRAVTLTFTPRDGQALVHLEPPLAGVQYPPSVPLIKGECGDWRTGLQADFRDANRLHFAGGYPASCLERNWPLAFADPRAYASRALTGIWQQMGGTLTGQVREGKVPAGLVPAFELYSPPLAEIIRDINKYSNNVMAQQLFLTLSLQRRGVGSLTGSREVLRQWWGERFGAADLPVFDNGSGLSRDDRISAQQLAQLLQAAWASPLMPELVASLPLSGIDGTMRRARGRAVGLAHLKTGSLRDVAGVAGYVHAASGKRYVLVAIANHAQANAIRPAIEALIEWTAADQ
jgi:D-alanyl-D-alanine carboxypeptidase/D-alanyl-D-alanine-endopeptidase (penicillin-binding protein 4)